MRGTVYSNSQFAPFQYVHIEIAQVPEKNVRNPNIKNKKMLKKILRLHDLCSSADVIAVIRWKAMRWDGDDSMR